MISWTQTVNGGRLGSSVPVPVPVRSTTDHTCAVCHAYEAKIKGALLWVWVVRPAVRHHRSIDTAGAATWGGVWLSSRRHEPVRTEPRVA